VFEKLTIPAGPLLTRSATQKRFFTITTLGVPIEHQNLSTPFLVASDEQSVRSTFRDILPGPARVTGILGNQFWFPPGCLIKLPQAAEGKDSETQL
jgi:hypothetical protein